MRRRLLCLAYLAATATLAYAVLWLLAEGLAWMHVPA